MKDEVAKWESVYKYVPFQGFTIIFIRFKKSSSIIWESDYLKCGINGKTVGFVLPKLEQKYIGTRTELERN